MNVQQRIDAVLKVCTCNLFATKDSMTEARDYTMLILKTSSDEDREAMVHVAQGVYHNTLVEELRKLIASVVNPTTRPLVRDDIKEGMTLYCVRDDRCEGEVSSQKFTKGSTYLIKVAEDRDTITIEDDLDESLFGFDELLSPSYEIKFEVIIGE